jgi:hypothetical protein
LQAQPPSIQVKTARVNEAVSTDDEFIQQEFMETLSEGTCRGEIMTEVSRLQSTTRYNTVLNDWCGACPDGSRAVTTWH